MTTKVWLIERRVYKMDALVDTAIAAATLKGHERAEEIRDDMQKALGGIRDGRLYHFAVDSIDLTE